MKPEAAAPASVWSEASYLVLRGTTDLPRLCLWCGSPAPTKSAAINLEWTPPVRFWIYPIGVIVGVVSLGTFLLLPRPLTAKVSVWFCSSDARRRLIYRILSTIFLALGLLVGLPAGVFIMAWPTPIPILSSFTVRFVLALVVMAGFFVGSVYVGRKYKYPVLPRLIDPANGVIRLSGACPEFLRAIDQPESGSEVTPWLDQWPN